MASFFGISHHGAINGVTGSCHELRLTDGPGMLLDCGLFQGAETSPRAPGPWVGPGRDIQAYGPRGGWVMLDGKRFDIKAGVHTINGYSAHAHQTNLVNFVARMQTKPSQIRIVHGDNDAKAELQRKYRALLPAADVIIPA